MHSEGPNLRVLLHETSQTLRMRHTHNLLLLKGMCVCHMGRVAYLLLRKKGGRESNWGWFLAHVKSAGTRNLAGFPAWHGEIQK